MSHQPSTYGVSPEKLTRLLQIGAEEALTQADLQASRIAQLLSEMLASRLPSFLEPDSVSIGTAGAPSGSSAPPQQPIGQLLCDPGTELATVGAIKRYMKLLAIAAGEQIQRAASTAIYYAAIASAMVFHGENISSIPYERLEKGFSDLEGRLWTDESLRRLYGQARQICRTRQQDR